MAFPSIKPRHVEGVAYSEVLDELVAYLPGSSQAVSLNASARAIWELCDGSRTILDICEELSEPAGLPPAALHADVRSAVDQLLALGMLTCTVR